MIYYRLYANSGLSQMTADDVGIVYAVDWTLVASGYAENSFIWFENSC